MENGMNEKNILELNIKDLDKKLKEKENNKNEFLKQKDNKINVLHAKI
jgi:hypothetical protein